MLALPLHHVGGLSVLFRAVLGGGTLAIPRVGESLVEALCRLAPSHVSLVPTQLAGLLEDPAAVAVLRACRLVLMGGPRPAEGLRRRSLELGIPVAASWGLTETGGQVCTALPGTPGSGPDSRSGPAGARCPGAKCGCTRVSCRPRIPSSARGGSRSRVCRSRRSERMAGSPAVWEPSTQRVRCMCPGAASGC